MKDVILKIVDDAIWAPSGDNSQPWRFNIRDNTLQIYNVPSKDQSLYNFNQHASLIAHGCVLENIKISANYHGVNAKIILTDLSSNHIADITFSHDEATDDTLYNSIRVRSSNRKIYSTERLSHTDIEKLISVGREQTGLSIKFANEKSEIETLASAASVNEKIVLENKKLHNFLFRHVTWTEKEDTKKPGFFVKTLELRGPQKIAFKLFSRWPILNFFNKIGASNMVSHENAKLYTASGAFGAITYINPKAESYIQTGMTFQRLWLMATYLKMSLQPLTGIIFLHDRIINGDSELIEPHPTLVEQAYAKMATIFKIKNEEKIVMLFRIGKSLPPTAKTKRERPEISFS